jgi:hypothetical protein
LTDISSDKGSSLTTSECLSPPFDISETIRLSAVIIRGDTYSAHGGMFIHYRDSMYVDSFIIVFDTYSSL